MSGEASVDAVVFDVGGVLLDWNPRHLYRKLFADDAAAMETFLSTICTPEWHAKHDLGRRYEDSCAELAAAHPAHAELIWAWALRNEEMVAGPIHGTIDIVAELRARGIRRFVLSNMEAETFPRRLERYPFLSWFDGYVISGLEGVGKPDERIFRRLLERFGLEASRTLFIDDGAANVEAARSAGMRAVLFDSPDQLRARLTLERLLEPAPA
jgi:2-haloacid dehalogenase